MPTDQPTTPNPKPRRYLYSLCFLLIFVLLPVNAILWYFLLPKGYEILIAVAIAGVAVLYLAFLYVNALLKHTPFQFSIRSILLLTAVVAVPLSWLGAGIEWARKQKEAVAELRDIGGKVEYSGNYEDHAFTLGPIRKPAAPEWLESMLGTEFFDTVDLVELDGDKFTDADLENVKDIRNLRLLRL